MNTEIHKIICKMIELRPYREEELLKFFKESINIEFFPKTRDQIIENYEKKLDLNDLRSFQSINKDSVYLEAGADKFNTLDYEEMCKIFNIDVNYFFSGIINSVHAYDNLSNNTSSTPLLRIPSKDNRVLFIFCTSYINDSDIKEILESDRRCLWFNYFGIVGSYKDVVDAIVNMINDKEDDVFGFTEIGLGARTFA